MTIQLTINLEQAFGRMGNWGGDGTMTDNEVELITLIRENDNPGQAFMAATLIILGFLRQHESSEAQAVAGLPVRG